MNGWQTAGILVVVALVSAPVWFFGWVVFGCWDSYGASAHWEQEDVFPRAMQGPIGLYEIEGKEYGSPWDSVLSKTLPFNESGFLGRYYGYGVLKDVDFRTESDSFLVVYPSDSSDTPSEAYGSAVSVTLRMSREDSDFSREDMVQFVSAISRESAENQAHIVDGWWGANASYSSYGGSYGDWSKQWNGWLNLSLERLYRGLSGDIRDPNRLGSFFDVDGGVWHYGFDHPVVLHRGSIGNQTYRIFIEATDDISFYFGDAELEPGTRGEFEAIANQVFADLGLPAPTFHRLDFDRPRVC